MNAKFYIEVGTFWNSEKVFIGPYTDKQAANNAVRVSGCARTDLGQQARNSFTQTQCRGVRNTTQSRKHGMTASNTYPPQKVPGTVEAFNEIRAY